MTELARGATHDRVLASKSPGEPYQAATVRSDVNIEESPSMARSIQALSRSSLKHQNSPPVERPIGWSNALLAASKGLGTCCWSRQLSSASESTCPAIGEPGARHSECRGRKPDGYPLVEIHLEKSPSRQSGPLSCRITA